jgi:protocatechuate 3,4-dioxygenase alpha subunit
VAVAVFARGLLHRVPTRIYFADEERANAADPLLSSLDPDRRATLIAAAEDGGYRFDIHLQGDHETVFFEL